MWKEKLIYSGEDQEALDHFEISLDGKSYNFDYNELKRIRPNSLPLNGIQEIEQHSSFNKSGDFYRTKDKLSLYYSIVDEEIFIFSTGENSPGQFTLRFEGKIPDSTRGSYYRMHFSSEPEVIGNTYPQVKDFYHPENPAIYSDSTYTKKHFSFLDQKVFFHHFKMHREAKMTDFISSSFLASSGIFMSKASKGLLENFNLDRKKFFDVKIYHKNLGYDKTFLQLLETDSVDFEKTLFSVEDVTSHTVIEENRFGSLEEMHNERKRLILTKDRPALKLRSLVLTKQFDLFKSPLNMNFYVSKSLKTAIEQAGLIGIKFLDPTFEINRSS